MALTLQTNTDSEEVNARDSLLGSVSFVLEITNGEDGVADNRLSVLLTSNQESVIHAVPEAVHDVGVLQLALVRLEGLLVHADYAGENLGLVLLGLLDELDDDVVRLVLWFGLLNLTVHL